MSVPAPHPPGQPWLPADRAQSETVGLVRELGNRLEAFSLFDSIDDVHALVEGGVIRLDHLIARAEAQGPYRSVFLREGIGYLYAKSELQRAAFPRGMLGPDHVPAVPSSALPLLHVGMGVRFAEHALGPRGAAEPARIAERYLSLWTANADPRWRPIAGEPLGFGICVLAPDLVRAVACALGRLAPGAASFYWHGVGRGLYFSPALALPLCGAHARAVWVATADAPSAEARRNALSGWAFALGLTNARHPDLLEAALVHASEAAPPPSALADGIGGMLALLDATAPAVPFRRRLLSHAPRDRHACRLWDQTVRRAASSRRALTDAFRFDSSEDGHHGDVAASTMPVPRKAGSPR